MNHTHPIGDSSVDTTMTDHFTRDLFYILHMDWNEVAKAREFLHNILTRDEDVTTILEDTVFAVQQFLIAFKKMKNLQDNRHIEPYVLHNDSFRYVFKIESSDHHETTLFRILDCHDGTYVFEKPVDSGEIQGIRLKNMDGLKETLLIWFHEFYLQIEEGMP